MTRYVIACVLAALLCNGAGQTKAGFVLYTDQAAFEANTTGLTTINFEGIAPDNDFTSISVPPGLTVSGVQFTIDQTNDDGNLFVLGTGYYYPNNSVLSSQESTTGPNNLVITVPGSGVTAVGMDISSIFGTTATFLFPTGDSFDVPTASLPDLGFVGFTSTTPFASLTIDIPNADILNVSSFSYGTAFSVSAVPEPASFAILGIGAVCLLGYTWRRQRSKERDSVD